MTAFADDPVVEFALRTQANLDATEHWRRSDQRDFFEVMQLVNSLLGLIVIPKEMHVVEDMRDLDRDFSSEGIKCWDTSFALVKREGRPPTQLRPFIRGLRNAIAHCSLQYLDDGHEVTGITFEHRSRDGKPLWDASFDIENLRRFLSKVADEVVAARQKQLQRERSRARRT